MQDYSSVGRRTRKTSGFAKFQASTQLLHHKFFPTLTFLASWDIYWDITLSMVTARRLNKNLTLQRKALAQVRYA